MVQALGKAARTAAAIERAAIEAVLEHGYDHATVDMICERAGISQRTFFNHFPTKDDAIMGSFRPQVDEAAAREFLVSDGPLLPEATKLFTLPPSFTAEDAKLHERRMRAVGSSSALFAKQMQVLGALHREVAGIVLMRLKRQRPHDTQADLQADAELTANMLTGVMRTAGQLLASQGVTEPDDAARLVRQSLERVLAAS